MAMKQQTQVLNIDQSEDDNLTQEFVDLDEQMLVGIILPATWTAANITFKVAQGTGFDLQKLREPSAFADLYDKNGNLVTVIGTAGAHITLDPSEFLGFRYMKLATTAGQAVDREISVVLRYGQ